MAGSHLEAAYERRISREVTLYRVKQREQVLWPECAEYLVVGSLTVHR